MSQTKKPPTVALPEVRLVLDPDGDPPQPEAVDIPGACRIGGWGRSYTYEKIASGELVGVKAGRRTLVLVSSIRAHLAALPRVAPAKRAAGGGR